MEVNAASVDGGTYGPVARDCNHERIFCFDKQKDLFAVKGPFLSMSQLENLCPATPKVHDAKRAVIYANAPKMTRFGLAIVNVDKEKDFYQEKTRIQIYDVHARRFKRTPKTKQNDLKFDYVLCGTHNLRRPFRLHVNADNPVPFNSFLSKSFSIGNVQNIPTNKTFKSSERKYAFSGVALGDSLAYVKEKYPLNNIKYETVGRYITGYQTTFGLFDKNEKLYKYNDFIPKNGISLITTLEKFVSRYGEPVSGSIQHDLNPINKVTSGTYVWHPRKGAKLTITINEVNRPGVGVKMYDASLADKAENHLEQATLNAAQDKEKAKQVAIKSNSTSIDF